MTEVSYVLKVLLDQINLKKLTDLNSVGIRDLILVCSKDNTFSVKEHRQRYRDVTFTNKTESHIQDL